MEIKTDGYYYATYDLKKEIQNTFFGEKAVMLIKFDNDGFCNVFIIGSLKGESISETIEKILERSNDKTKTSSGTYNIVENKIYIKYLIFKDPNHFIGKYVERKYEGYIGKNALKLETDLGNLKFEYVQNADISYYNYFRDGKIKRNKKSEKKK